MQIRDLTLTTDQRSAHARGDVAFANHAVVDDQFVDALDRLRRHLLEGEHIADHPFDRHRDGDGARLGEAAHPRRQIGSEAVDVVLGGVEIDESTVNPDPDADVEPEASVAPARSARRSRG